MRLPRVRYNAPFTDVLFNVRLWRRDELRPVRAVIDPRQALATVQGAVQRIVDGV